MKELESVHFELQTEKQKITSIEEVSILVHSALQESMVSCDL